MPLQARLSQRVLRFDPSPSPDVTGYRLYYSPDADISSYENEDYIDIGTRTEITMQELLDAGLEEREYWFMAVPYDAAGNLAGGEESGPFVFDLTPPEPAGAVTVQDS